MAHHVSVGVVAENEVVLPRLDRLAEHVGHAWRAHFGHQVVGRTPVSNPSQPATSSARTIGRMRSARKLKQNTPSPERMRGVPVITRGLTNSSVSPAW